MRILGIETSCDDTAAAVVEDGTRVLSAERLSSAALQSRFGGVVPEVAAREHAMTVLPVVETALEQAGLGLEELDAVAVTQGPGLLGALLVGVSFAKALGVARHLPVIGVHHLEAHLYANALVDGLYFPALALVVSGGHTTLVYWQGHGVLEVLGETRDDAAGEALDKGARLLGLGYPGGPLIERLAREAAVPPAVKLPVARLEGDSLDFSFSGLKTATEEMVRRGQVDRASIAWALEDAVVAALARTLDRAWQRYPTSHVYLAGGVSANRRLAETVQRWAQDHGVIPHIPPPQWCTDNGAMVAAAGYFRYQRGDQMRLDEGPKTPWPLATLERSTG
ncbi:MAG: tRNA (adenosine(37)-N6)-threonylcarbamoyltransferase complex transferase subunit TsaD [Firmicutes bacterium]|nr:tRNA (adenosine(37)-N6)-threonylcarbamoyltransferase complex transferase subunit TsaD [Bacillota bacterium]